MEVFLRDKKGNIYKRNFEYTPKMFFAEMEKGVELVSVVVKKKDGIIVRDSDSKPIEKVTVLKGKEKSEVYDFHKNLAEKQSAKVPVQNDNVSRETYAKAEVDKMIEEMSADFEATLEAPPMGVYTKAEVDKKLAELENRFTDKIEVVKRELTPK